MVDLKFRAWDETQHKMLQVDCIEFIDGVAYWVEASHADDDVQGRSDGPIGDNCLLKLEQYTGMKDVNGKEIYEGDIIITHPKYGDEESKRGIVEYGNCRAEFSYEIRKGDNRSIWSSNEYRTYEVIGNVHANPELLEAQHD